MTGFNVGLGEGRDAFGVPGTASSQDGAVLTTTIHQRGAAFVSHKTKAALLSFPKAAPPGAGNRSRLDSAAISRVHSRSLADSVCRIAALVARLRRVRTDRGSLAVRADNRSGWYRPANRRTRKIHSWWRLTRSTVDRRTAGWCPAGRRAAGRWCSTGRCAGSRCSDGAHRAHLRDTQLRLRAHESTFMRVSMPSRAYSPLRLRRPNVTGTDFPESVRS